MIRSLALCLLAAASAHAAAVVDDFSDIEFWVGTGPNQAAIVIDWQDGKTAPGEAEAHALVWGYRWEDGQTPKGIDALMAIDAADPRLELYLTSFGSVGGGKFFFGAFYDLDGDGGTATFDPTGETGFSGDSDDHFQEGIRLNGYWRYLIGSGPQLPESWTVSGSGASVRTLSDNSWDAWVFADYAITPEPFPGIAVAAPVPEPSSIALALSGLALAFMRRR